MELKPEHRNLLAALREAYGRYLDAAFDLQAGDVKNPDDYLQRNQQPRRAYLVALTAVKGAGIPEETIREWLKAARNG